MKRFLFYLSVLTSSVLVGIVKYNHGDIFWWLRR